MLENFSTEELVWDKASKYIYDTYRTSTSDEHGRKLVVRVVNGGVVEDLRGYDLSLGWEHKFNGNSGLDAFEPVDAKNGIFEIHYTTGMMSNHGKLRANLYITNGQETVTSEPFTLEVFKGVNMGKVEASDSFSTLSGYMVRLHGLENNFNQWEGNEEDRQAREDERRLEEVNRRSNESNRKLNEEERVDSENLRKQEEQSRVNVENSRVTAEDNREIAENNRKEKEDERERSEDSRKDAEDNRETAENNRKENEEERERSEDSRKDAEEVRRASEVSREEEEGRRVGAENAREVAEDDRVSSENERVESENERSAEYTKRINQESERVNAENLRVQAEQGREVSEADREVKEEGRVTAEEGRVVSEQGRESAEQERVENENARKATEAEVIESEALRKEAELSRVNAEDGRVTSENLREQEYNKRLTNEDGRVLAEQERESAEADREANEGIRVTAEQERELAEQGREGRLTGIEYEIGGTIQEKIDEKIAEAEAIGKPVFVDRKLQDIDSFVDMIFEEVFHLELTNVSWISNVDVRLKSKIRDILQIRLNGSPLEINKVNGLEYMYNDIYDWEQISDPNNPYRVYNKDRRELEGVKVKVGEVKTKIGALEEELNKEEVLEYNGGRLLEYLDYTKGVRLGRSASSGSGMFKNTIVNDLPKYEDRLATSVMYITNGMFEGATLNKTVSISDLGVVIRPQYASEMFQGLRISTNSLTLDLRDMDLSRITNARNMFKNASVYGKVILPPLGALKDEATNTTGIFEGARINLVTYEESDVEWLQGKAEGNSNVTIEYLDMVEYKLNLNDNDGNPIVGATFELLRDGEVFRTATSDKDGLLNFGMVPRDGKYTLNKVR